MAALSDLLRDFAENYPDISVSEFEARRLQKLFSRIIEKMETRYKACLPFPPKEVLARYSYNPFDGTITKLMKNGTHKVIGKKHITGYVRLEIKSNGKRWRVPAHRLGWRLYYGTEPPDGLVIHHIDGNRANNRLSNLAAVRHSTNMALAYA